MTNYQSITLSVADHVAHLTLNRPERLNALHKAALVEINRAMDEAEADAEVRVVVVSGAGRAFSSGFDLKAQMEQQPVGPQVWREILDLDFDTTMRFWNSPKPTIAAVHGACLAGAFELAIRNGTRERRGTGNCTIGNSTASSCCTGCHSPAGSCATGR